ncbi:MAG: Holliday junction branch migration protein RuvA [Bacilli bacterium]|nr:Holliday junction branch migration protein RuvA [Bacilli bacterium]
MYSYIKGKIVDIESNYIVLENNNMGYLIYTANPYSFKLNVETVIFLYQYVREDEISLYGFKTKEEKEMFLKLIEVKGLGCKMALPMLANGAVDGIISAIESENINYLKKFPKIGDKVARQIILDLKGKLVSGNVDIKESNNEELMEALKSLGYKLADIKKVLTNVSKDDTIENQIKEALKLLMR